MKTKKKRTKKKMALEKVRMMTKKTKTKMRMKKVPVRGAMKMVLALEVIRTAVTTPIRKRRRKRKVAMTMKKRKRHLSYRSIKAYSTPSERSTSIWITWRMR